MFISKKIGFFWNSGTYMTWASLGFKSLNLIILIPFILRTFSPEEIVLWYLFSSIVSLNLMIDLGFSPTFTRFIAYTFGKKISNQLTDENYFIRLISTQRKLFFYLSVIIFISLASIGSGLVYKSLVSLKNLQDGWLSWGVIVLGTTLSFWGNTNSVFLQGIHRIAEFRRVEAIFSFLSILTSLIALYFNLGLLGLVAIGQFWLVVCAISNEMLYRKYSRSLDLNINRIEFDKSIFKEIWPSAWKSGIGVLMSYGLIQATSIFYAQHSSAENASSYLFASRLMQIIITFAQVPFYSKIPLLASLYATGKKKELLLLAQRQMAKSHWMFVVLTLGVFFSAHFMMSLLKSNISFVDERLWILMTVAFFVERFGAMHIQLYSLSNNIIWHILNGITGIICIALIFVLYPYWGVYAFPLSTFIGYCAFYSWYSAKMSYGISTTNFIQFERYTSLPQFAIILMLLIFTWSKYLFI